MRSDRNVRPTQVNGAGPRCHSTKPALSPSSEGPRLHKQPLSGCQCWFQLAGFESFEALVDFGPIHDIPPGRKIFRTAVVVLQVVGVLTDVGDEMLEEALGHWVVL